MAGWYGEKSELRRRIAYNTTMIKKTREKAEAKIAEYESKTEALQEELNALEGK